MATPIYYDPLKWEATPMPGIKDPRWVFGLLLAVYVVLGLTVLGFSRTPMQVLMLIGFGALLDYSITGLTTGKSVFPLSAIISCLSLSILLNYSYGFQYVLLPPFFTIASKHLLRFNGRHIYNPSMFGIVVCILFFNKYISIAPAYQWYGGTHGTIAMAAFIITGALVLFLGRVNRGWLVASFLFFYCLQTLLRAYILRFVLPPSTLFVGSLTSPAFYLFSFYMITDPATSPPDRKQQIIVGFFLAGLDLFFHTKASLFTFFFAGITVATVRAMINFYKNRAKLLVGIKENTFGLLPKLVYFSFIFVPLLLAMNIGKGNDDELLRNFPFHLVDIPANEAGISSRKSNILNEVDTRIRHVAKWLLSVGDAVACADVDMDGRQDIFLTQILKDPKDRASLYLNKGQFKFEKTSIPDLEKYLNQPVINGLPAFALFFDYDNDGDKDLFVGFAFANSHLFRNDIIPSGQLSFKEVSVPFLRDSNTVCLAANGFDFDNNGTTDLIFCNTLPPYMHDYSGKVPFNIFALPQPAYNGDRRMLHFLHNSWHNADNGGGNHLLINDKNGNFTEASRDQIGFRDTRWSLAIGTSDLNGDGFTDLYIANDFGPDECYLNDSGKRFKKQLGKYFGDIGMDTYKGMNTTMADLNNDGSDDIYISNVHHSLQAEGSLLWVNNTPPAAGHVVLKEQAAQMNLLNINRFGWGAAAVDLNLDGYLDIIQANGMVGDDWDKIYNKRSDYWYYQAQIAKTSPDIHSYADKWADIRGRSIYENEQVGVFLNIKGIAFADVAERSGMIVRSNTRGVAAVDMDNDGDADLIITDQFKAPHIYRNDIAKKQWIGFTVSGDGKKVANDAVGTKLKLMYLIDGQTMTQCREVRLVNGFSAQGDERVLFGLGEVAKKVTNVKLEIMWPDGTRKVFNDLRINRYITINR